LGLKKRIKKPNRFLFGHSGFMTFPTRRSFANLAKMSIQNIFTLRFSLKINSNIMDNELIPPDVDEV